MGHIAWVPACGSAWRAESVTSGSVVPGFGLLLLCVADGSLSFLVWESLQRSGIQLNMFGRSALLAASI